MEWAPAARNRGEASGGGGSAGGAEPNECAEEEAEVAAVGRHGKRADKLPLPAARAKPIIPAARAKDFVPKTQSILQLGAFGSTDLKISKWSDLTRRMAI